MSIHTERRVVIKQWLVTMLLMIYLLVAKAQTKANYNQDSIQAKPFGINVDMLTFFRNNEYDSHLTKGYTLPGARVIPAFFYDPNPQIHLELGASALLFSGANKYPCYAYHDISVWKGNQYQSGAHVLPWVRAQVNMKDVSIILGNIYGSTCHDFITPMYNIEQTMSADPEIGAQILVNHKGFNLDVYLDWQSFQFKEDTHQEAFTVGIITKTSLERTRRLNAVINILSQHRGGELDNIDARVQTLWNASMGLDWKCSCTGVLSEWHWTANILGCWQQTGDLWSFNSGLSLDIEGSLELIRQITLSIGYFITPKNFVSLYGNPFFSTLSLRDATVSFENLSTPYFNFDWHRTFKERYKVGAFLESYLPNSTGLHEFDFAFGLYIRATPKFLF